MREDPGVDVGATDAAGRPHVRDNAAEPSPLQQTNSVGSRVGRGASVTVALQGVAEEGDYRAFVLDKQQRQRLTCGRRGHGLAPAVAAILRSSLMRIGRRTLKVAPGVS